MRHGNLPDESHDRVAQKRNRDLITRRHKNITQRRGGDISQWHCWVFHLGLTREVVETYQWDVSVMYHWKVVGCFIWDLFETLWRHWLDFVMSYHWWDVEMLWRHTTEMSWWCSIETLCDVSFETYLQHPWYVQGDVVMLPQHLVAMWVANWGILLQIAALSTAKHITLYNVANIILFCILHKTLPIP